MGRIKTPRENFNATVVHWVDFAMQPKQHYSMELKTLVTSATFASWAK